jgi:hypothetical protein
MQLLLGEDNLGISIRKDSLEITCPGGQTWKLYYGSVYGYIMHSTPYY